MHARTHAHAGVHGGGEAALLRTLFSSPLPPSASGSDPRATPSSSCAADPYGLAAAALALCRAPDPSAVLLGLRVVSLVLRGVRGGPRLVEELDGIDALESVDARGLMGLQAGGAADEGLLGEVCEWAHALVDQYYGEDYDPDADADVGDEGVW